MATEQRYAVLGLAEHELRPELEQELVRTMRAEGEAPTVHAIATALRGSWARPPTDGGTARAGGVSLEQAQQTK